MGCTFQSINYRRLIPLTHRPDLPENHVGSLHTFLSLFVPLESMWPISSPSLQQDTCTSLPCCSLITAFISCGVHASFPSNLSPLILCFFPSSQMQQIIPVKPQAVRATRTPLLFLYLQSECPSLIPSSTSAHPWKSSLATCSCLLWILQTFPF